MSEVPTRKVWLVTGGAGFIGANFVLMQRRLGDVRVINLDKLTYAGNLRSLASLADDPDHLFVHGDIGDRQQVRALLAGHRPTAIVNFAAESHVDRSILGPDAFVQTNVVGTFALLQEARDYWRELAEPERSAFRFLHVSTDEVYGTLEPDDPPFHEDTPYRPNSPYAASKAAADHLVRACFHTYGLPVLTTNCSNNYGPLQFPEKLIPLMIHNALAGEPLPVYGDGRQVRDWLYVEDHCAAIRRVLERGRPGETYNIGGRAERANLELVHRIVALLDELAPDSPHRPHERLIRFVADRPGHDRRYAIDDRKLRESLGWRPAETFESGLRKTVRWYLDNGAWLESVRSEDYRRWIDANYQHRDVGAR
jgi:dTDP-glucose 4,6-dehydratase